METLTWISSLMDTDVEWARFVLTKFLERTSTTWHSYEYMDSKRAFERGNKDACEKFIVDYSERMAKARMKIHLDLAHEAKTTEELSNVLRIASMIDWAICLRGGRVDWNALADRTDIGRAGRVIVKILENVYLSPYTHIGKKRLSREFEKISR
jgi:hypothetical protein